MKTATLLAAFLLPLASGAQGTDSVAAEKARINAERNKAEATFKAEEKACYRKFAVNDCLKEARDKRRQVVTDLRRQEISINDAERKRKGAERLREIEEKKTAEKEAEDARKREKALAEQQGRDKRATEKAADRASAAASAPGKKASKEAQLGRRAESKAAAERSRNEEAAESVKKREEKLAEAKERKEKLAKRLAERKKAPAKPLPVPP